MLIHPTVDKLMELKLTGMVSALRDHQNLPQIADLSFEERLGLMVDRELTDRQNKRTAARLSKARLRQAATPEDIDYRSSRGLDKSLYTRLLDGKWVTEHHNVLFTGPTGVGKTYLACALANQACRQGATVQYFRTPRLLHDLTIAKLDGSYAKLLKTLAKTDILVLDDWGLAQHTPESRRDLLEIFDDRHQRGSTIITSQLAVEHWHESIGDPTMADAILDRLIHNAHRIALTGESMRKRAAEKRTITPAKVDSQATPSHA